MDLNVMMRDQARAGLNTALDAAVTNGDTAEARKITDQIAALAVSSAPKAPPYGNAEVTAELEKLPWFGTDPKKSARTLELGKHLDIKKFATAALFTEALVKAVDEEFKPTPAAGEEPEDGEGDEPEDDPNKGKTADEKKPRRTDGPGEGDTTQRSARSGRSGPWVKIGDAPADVQKEVNRTADKFLPAKATKEQRDAYVKNALASHYAIAQRNKAGK